MLLALVAFLLFRRRRRRRHPIPPDFTVDSFDSAAPLNHMSLAPTTVSATSGYRTGKPALSDSDDTRPYTITSVPSTTSDPHARTDEKVRLLHVTDPKGHGQGSGSTSPGLSTPGMGTVDLDAPPSGSTARGEDVVQMQALSEAMQRAGFSPAALLESLNRVHERADDEVAALETTTNEARTRPPQYRE